MQIRYIRDWIKGNSVDMGCSWVEIQAIQGTANIALNKTVTASAEIKAGSLILVTDGITTSSSYLALTDATTTDARYVQIDLGSIVSIDKVVVWHYYSDGRTYHSTKTEVGSDGTNFETVFDSTALGEYAETSTGHTITLPTTQKKYLIKSGTKLYTIVSGALTEITGTVNAALFNQYGVSSIPSSVLPSLTNPSVLYWQSSSTEPLAGVYANVTAIPPPQVITTTDADMSDATIAGIKAITVNLEVTANGTALFAMSLDSGTTWQAFNGTTWQAVDITSVDNFTSNGMTKTVLEAITQTQWTAFLGTVEKYRFAVMINRPSVNDAIKIHNINVTYLNV